MVVFITYLDVMASLPMAKLRYDERPVVFAVISLVSIFLNIVMNLWFILIQKETSVEYVFIANLIASGFKFALLVFFSMPFAERLKQFGKFGAKLAGIKVLPTSLQIDKSLMKPMASFGFYIMLAGLFGMINQYSDVNFIQRVWGDEGGDYHGTWYTGSEMAGIFSANKKLAVLILLVTQAFRYAAEPFFFRQARESNSKAIFARVFHYFMLASLAVFLFISVFAKEFVSIRIGGFQLINERYHVGLEVVPLLLFSFVLWGAYINISIWFKLTKQVRFGLLFSGIGVITIVIFNLILIPLSGYMGAAVSMLICYAVMCTLVYLAGRKYYPIPYRIGRIGLLMALFLAAYFIGAAMGDSEIFSGLFFGKLAVCAGTVGLAWGIDKFFPVKW
jgi:O-antigen/teichoic acid export membrane protein